MYYSHQIESTFLAVVKYKFKNYIGSKREILNPDPTKIRSFVAKKFRAWSYTISQNIKKQSVVQQAQLELEGLLQ